MNKHTLNSVHPLYWFNTIPRHFIPYSAIGTIPRFIPYSAIPRFIPYSAIPFPPFRHSVSAFYPYPLGMPHPHGTCVLLEVNSINSLTEYFRNGYKPNVLFELRGIKITVAQITNQHTNDSDTNTCPSTSNKFNSGKCCAICYYSICYIFAHA